MENQSNNRLKSIRQLAVVDGWFDQEEGNPNRYSLHLNASFRRERLGGVESSNIHFRVLLRQCEIVVELPERGNGFDVDPRTVARSAPASPITVSDKEHRSDTTQAEMNFELGGKTTGAMRGLFGRKKQTSQDVESVRQVAPLESLQSLSEDGHRSWIVSSPLHNVLEGSLWEADKDPRYTVIDRRPKEQIEFEREQNIAPVAVVAIRCKREDVHIYDIKFKQLEEDNIQQNRANQKTRERAAESYLKSEMQRQGLRVGNIQDKFSEMTLAEYTIPLFL